VLLVLGSLAVVNVLSAMYHWRIDTTQRRIHSLSDQTVELLKSLDRDVQAVAFYRDQERGEFEHLLKEYAYHSSRFSYRFVDPDKTPREARSYRIKSYGTTVLEVGQREERLQGADERTLTNAIARAVREGQKVIYFLTGHGEVSVESTARDGFRRLRELLEEANYVVRDGLMLSKTPRVPADCDLLVVAGPRAPFYAGELDSLRAYLERGGDALFLLDPSPPTGLEDVLVDWGVGTGANYIVEGSTMGRLHGFDFSMPMVGRYGEHPVTQKHHGLVTVFLIARTIQAAGTVPGVDVTELAMTSAASWGEVDLSTLNSGKQPRFDEGKDARGPLSLAMAVTAPPRTREVQDRPGSRAKTQLVVFGDSDFANNQLISEAGNADLLLNAVSWLVEEGRLIAIRPKERGYRPVRLTEGEGTRLKWLSLLIIPAIPVVAGVLVWWRRR